MKKLRNFLKFFYFIVIFCLGFSFATNFWDPTYHKITQLIETAAKSFAKKENVIYFDKASTNAKAMLKGHYNLTNNPDDADLLWLRKRYNGFYSTLKSFQLLNHIPKESVMIDKGNILKALTEYDRETKDDRKQLNLSGFYKESYRLYDDKEKQQFIKRYRQNVGDNIWILKPTNLSKGRGMKIVADKDRFSKIFLQPSFIDKKPYIVQKYISNVLLLDGRKSEIRVYFLIASLDPLLVFVYPEGSVRLCANKYKLDDYDNVSIHITNVFQQRKNPAHIGKRLKWGFSELNDCLVKEKGMSENYINDTLLPKVKNILRYVIAASRDELINVPKDGLFFGLYGADVIIDDNLTPWLAEIQIGPGLDFSDPIKKDFLPDLFNEAIGMVLEVRDKKAQGEAIDQIMAQKKFERIV